MVGGESWLWDDFSVDAPDISADFSYVPDVSEIVSEVVSVDGVVFEGGSVFVVKGCYEACYDEVRGWATEGFTEVGWVDGWLEGYLAVVSFVGACCGDFVLSGLAVID